MIESEKSRKVPREKEKRFLSADNLRKLIALTASILLLSIFLITISPTRYALNVGMVPPVTISATKDVIDSVTTEHNRDLAAAVIAPSYRYQDGITEKVMNNLDQVKAQAIKARQYAQTLPDYSPRRSYTVVELNEAKTMLDLVNLRDYQLITLLNTSQQSFDDMLDSLLPAVRNTMQGNVTQGQESIAINSIMQVVGVKINVNLLQNVVLPILQTIILPNMVIDAEATEAARDAARNSVDPVVFKQGQNIVVRGEGRIKDNQIKMLNSLGLMVDNKVDYSMYLGGFVFASLSLSLLYMLLKALCKNVFEDIRKISVFYAVLVLTLGLCLLAKIIHLLYIAPIILSALLLSVTIGVIPALIASNAISIMASIMLSSTSNTNAVDLINLIVASLFSSNLIILMLKNNSQRPRILLTGALSILSGFVVITTIGFLTTVDVTNTLAKALWSMAGSLIALLLCLALQPVLESLFNLPSQNHLTDLTNPNHPLLRRLLLEAPGTYHHSIIIANLAEASAQAIGANPLLARAGGYFHDIGKLKRPLYFKENQIGQGNIHDQTNPQVSAAIITAHVRDGLQYAKQYKLPYEIRQIIAEHHGNSIVAYFYKKAMDETSCQLDDKEFRYDGTPPRSAEGALVMICDTIEAAIRTLNAPSPEEILSFIDTLIHKKIEDGQLVNAPLTLNDLEIIKNTCAKVIYGVFHERVEYPPIPDRLSPGEKIKAHVHQLLKSYQDPKASAPIPLQNVSSELNLGVNPENPAKAAMETPLEEGKTT